MWICGGLLLSMLQDVASFPRTTKEQLLPRSREFSVLLECKAQYPEGTVRTWSVFSLTSFKGRQELDTPQQSETLGTERCLLCLYLLWCEAGAAKTSLLFAAWEWPESPGG